VAGEVGVKSLEVDGFVVENFAAALMDNVVELGLGSLDGFNEGADLREEEDGAPGFEGGPGLGGKAAKRIPSGTSGVRWEGELFCESKDLFVS
jgi:hypothetical protein